jgi:hypothetical protein
MYLPLEPSRCRSRSTRCAQGFWRHARKPIPSQGRALDDNAFEGSARKCRRVPRRAIVQRRSAPRPNQAPGCADPAYVPSPAFSFHLMLRPRKSLLCRGRNLPQWGVTPLVLLPPFCARHGNVIPSALDMAMSFRIRSKRELLQSDSRLRRVRMVRYSEAYIHAFE